MGCVDGMKIDRRLMLLGVMLVVLSMTMATQYATTKVTYSYSIVHPSNADIRFIGSDNSSDDNIRCLRVTTNSTGNQYVTLEFGDWPPNSQINYTAAFGIVNEESYQVNLTHINVSGINASYLDVWIHGDRDVDAVDDGTGIQVINDGTALFGSNANLWVLAAGDGDPDTINATDPTPWDTEANVRYSLNNTDAENSTSDFVWVQVNLDITQYASVQDASGTIFCHFRADSS